MLLRYKRSRRSRTVFPILLFSCWNNNPSHADKDLILDCDHLIRSDQGESNLWKVTTSLRTEQHSTGLLVSWYQLCHSRLYLDEKPAHKSHTNLEKSKEKNTVLKYWPTRSILVGYTLICPLDRWFANWFIVDPTKTIAHCSATIMCFGFAIHGRSFTKLSEHKTKKNATVGFDTLVTRFSKKYWISGRVSDFFL